MVKWPMVVFLTFGVTLVYGADPCPECPTEVVIDDVSGGLSTTLPDYKIGASFSPFMRNVMVDNGRIELVGGFEEIGGTITLGPITGIFPFFKEDGETQFIVTDSSIALSTIDFVFYTFIIDDLNTGVLLRCKQIRNNMWCSNGADSVFSWDGLIRTDLDGTGGTPDVPKGKFIEYYHERVWIYNLPSDGSSSRYSDFRSTNGFQISPENFLAWPAGNGIEVGEGDGQVGTGIWVENTQLQFGKERSIYTLFGLNRSNYNPKLSAPDVGVVSHDSIKLIDGLAHFLGPDGVYVGRTRITDHIEGNIDAVNKDTQKVLADVWEIKPDFEPGSFYGTTATAIGILGLPEEQLILPLDSQGTFPDFTIPGNNPLQVGGTFYGPARLQFLDTWGDQSLYVEDINPLLARSGSPAVHPQVKVILKNFFTGETHSTVAVVTGGGQRIFFSSQTIFEGFQVKNSSFIIHFEYINSGDTDGSAITIALDLNTDFKLHPATTGQFISDIATKTSITAWGKLDSVRETNSGTIDYFVRTGTDAFHVYNSTRLWVPITPGANIGSPVGERFVSWATTLTSISSFTNIPEIDNVTISHIEGGSAQNRAFSAKWMNRYWMWTTTESSNLSLGFIKARNTSQNPVAWMPIEGIDLRAMATAGDTLYGGSSSTGIFYRLDFGTNYNGTAIQGVYDTPAKFMGDIFNEKNLLEYYLIDDRSPGKEITLGVSIDGKDFVDQTIDLDGTGQVVKTIRKVRTPNTTGKLFKFRFTHNQLDKPLAIRNFGVLYRPTKVRSGINE